MFKLILAFCGYVKVPKEAIQLCMRTEDDFKEMGELFKDNPRLQSWFSQRQNSMRILTEFLRSGRLLSA